MENENKEKIIDSTDKTWKVGQKVDQLKGWVKKNPTICISVGFGLAGLAMKFGFMYYNSQCYIDHLAVLEEGIKLAQAGADV